jgi:hypothetical protein
MKPQMDADERRWPTGRLLIGVDLRSSAVPNDFECRAACARRYATLFEVTA